MKSFVILLGAIFFITTFSGLPTTINGRFVILNSDNSELSVCLQINSNTGTDDLGSTTIVFSFDTNAISFSNTPLRNVDYIFNNFSGGNYSTASVTKPISDRIWVNIFLPFNHSNNGTLVAASPGWTDVVTLNFSIKNPNLSPGFSWFTSSNFWGFFDADNITLWETGNFEGNFGLEVNILNGWNLVSVPGINPDGQSINTWWQWRDPSSSVFKLSGGSYELRTITQPGEGYWVDHISNRVYNTGDEWPSAGIQKVENVPINVQTGWNSIGGFENIVEVNQLTTTPPNLITGIIYEYVGEYRMASHLIPGHGYIVKLSGPGQIHLSNNLIKSVNSTFEQQLKENWGEIIFRDDRNRSFVLYSTNSETDLDFFELPPIPPIETFDIRYASNRITENLTNEIQIIELRGVDFPINVNIENINLHIQDESGKKINVTVNSGDEITIEDDSIDKLFVSETGSTQPEQYLLEQNYPNPFNPTTKIKFSLKEDSNVELKIFNILGEQVSTLVNEYLETGNYEFDFNGSNLASGIYIYTIKAGEFVESKKMVLMK